MATRVPTLKLHLDETLPIDAVLYNKNGDVLNLSGMSGTDIRWTLADKPGGDVLVDINLSNTPDPENGGSGIAIVSAANGQVSISLGWLSQDDLVPNRRYWQQCDVISAEGRSVQFEGWIRVKKSNTAEVA